jgi:hypothetical protein
MSRSNTFIVGLFCVNKLFAKIRIMRYICTGIEKESR